MKYYQVYLFKALAEDTYAINNQQMCKYAKT